MLKHLIWSILGQHDVFDRMEFKDLMSVIFELVLIALFLVIGVILLINLLIALLTHTFERTQVRDDILHFLVAGVMAGFRPGSLG